MKRFITMIGYLYIVIFFGYVCCVDPIVFNSDTSKIMDKYDWVVKRSRRRDLQQFEDVVYLLGQADVGDVFTEQASIKNQSFSRAIVKEDNRVLIESTEYFPFSAVGILESGCTGFVIGARYILTAAHCLYLLGDWNYNQNFTPGQKNSSIPFNQYEWDSLRVPLQWFQNETALEYDFGLVILKQDIEQITGMFDFEANCDNTKMPLFIMGYPIDKMPEKTQWLATCDVVDYDCTKMTFFHTCDTYAGMSGSPMFEYRPHEDSVREFIVHGIHFGSSILKGYNQALTINQRVRQKLDQWFAEDL